MGRLAADVGVSRQTVHTEIGTKGDLAQALVLLELSTFLDKVRTAFAAEPADVGAAIRGAVASVLGYAEQSPLLRAVVSSSHGAATDLLPLLTTNPATLLDTATTAVLRLVADYELPLPPRRVAVVVDVVVRAVISHVMYPTTSPEETAENLAWIVEGTVSPRR